MGFLYISISVARTFHTELPVSPPPEGTAVINDKTWVRNDRWGKDQLSSSEESEQVGDISKVPMVSKCDVDYNSYSGLQFILLTQLA